MHFTEEMNVITELVKPNQEILSTLKQFSDDEQKQIFAALKEVIIDDLAMIMMMYQLQKNTN
ncbi:hypothetical protein AWH56_008730 [Anaerobacillus isosaccharinicus]|uniref:Uncharacterized protein n=1 Tax=Anaerobacillus isosaccharinicus TaxID=1532552 RepID=A0A1S2L1G7_9BACI|nr:hypothetical protein [Anaerobacillus isosaccharinicus]MBA5588942.1 hypothetical protein [Anaerobacillus isosaccharinicus]QOY37649.1 hypothetical protein AWH56_008730 [Anaerobacillus isosaccharinicus]